MQNTHTDNTPVVSCDPLCIPGDFPRTGVPILLAPLLVPEPEADSAGVRGSTGDPGYVMQDVKMSTEAILDKVFPQPRFSLSHAYTHILSRASGARLTISVQSATYRCLFPVAPVCLGR